MADDNLKALVSQGLAAMRSGSDVAAQATDEIENDVSHPDLKALLKTGSEVAKGWSDRIDRALKEAGGGDQTDNPVLEAHVEVSRRIRQKAPDATSRDLGIIANGQLALHYWIAMFGTMANYTRQLGMETIARDMQSSGEEAKQGDEKMTELAEKMLQAA